MAYQHHHRQLHPVPIPGMGTSAVYLTGGSGYSGHPFPSAPPPSTSTESPSGAFGGTPDYMSPSSPYYFDSNLASSHRSQRSSSVATNVAIPSSVAGIESNNKRGTDSRPLLANGSDKEGPHKKRKIERMGVAAVRGKLSLVPESEIDASIEFPRLETLSPLDRARVKEIDLLFLSGSNVPTVVQKGLIDRPDRIILTYYWLWDTESWVSLVPLCKLLGGNEYLLDIDVNPTGNTCQKELMESFGARTLCFCHNCYASSTGLVREQLNEEEERRQPRGGGGHQTTGLGSDGPSTPYATATGQVATSSQRSLSIDHRQLSYATPGDGGFFVGQPYCIMTANGYTMPIATNRDQQQQFRSNFAYGEETLASPGWPRFRIHIRKASNDENRIYSTTTH